MKNTFDYEGAKSAGYSDEEIMSHLAERNPKFDLNAAQQAGYSPQEINEHLINYRPQRSKGEKAGRVAAQYALGAAEGAAFIPKLAMEVGRGGPSGITGALGQKGLLGPVGMAVTSGAKKAEEQRYREEVLSDIERLQEQKSMGQWDEQDQNLYDSLVEQIKNPDKAREFVQSAENELDFRNIAEKLTGQDLEPEGVLEKAANWAGFIKDPKKLAQLGLNPKNVVKNIFPTGTEAMRGAGAGTLLQMAEEGNFGPLGTMGAAVLGDVVGGGGSQIVKALAKPKQTLAKGVALLQTGKKAIKADLEEAMQGTQFTRDIGTITDNSIIKMVQARLTASGLTGRPLENLRKQMTREVVGEYEAIAKDLGEARFQTLHEAGEAAQKGLIEIRDADRAAYRGLYQNAENALKEDSYANVGRLAKTVERIEKKLTPGSIKSTEQKAVLDTLEKLKKDLIFDSAGDVRFANVKELMNNKIALNDIINYEVQGGAKQYLKEIVHEIDKSILSHGKENPMFAKMYAAANKKFGEHAQTFRNKNISTLLNAQDPMTLMNKMNSVQGIKDMKDVLYKTAEGKQTFDSLARLKFDQMIGNNMKDGVTEQLKSGTFANILQKGKNKEIVKELLSPEAYKRFVDLQKHVGKLADSAQKFFNASQSATASADLATVGAILFGVFSVFSGDPWALTALGTVVGARGLSKLMADSEFLKMVEKSVNASQKNNKKLMTEVAEQMTSYVRGVTPALLENLKQNQEDSML